MRRCFTRSLYARDDWSAAGYAAESSLLFAELAANLDRRDRAASALVLPTCEQTQLRAVADLTARGVLPKTVDVLGWLLHPPQRNPNAGTSQGEQLDEYRDAIRQLGSARDGEAATWLCCETEALLTLYDDLPGATMKLARVPSLAGEFAPLSATRRQSVHFVVAGDATVTRRKGYELLPEAVRTVLAEHVSATFTIHGASEDNPEAAAILKVLTQCGPRVKVLSRAIDSERYYALIRSADVLLLPYALPDYQICGSGIFSESLCYGIPVIAPAGCAFAADAIRDRRAIALQEHTPAALAAAILDAARSIDELRHNCRAFLSGQDNAAPGTVLKDFFMRVAERTTP